MISDFGIMIADSELLDLNAGGTRDQTFPFSISDFGFPISDFQFPITQFKLLWPGEPCLFISDSDFP